MTEAFSKCRAPLLLVTMLMGAGATNAADYEFRTNFVAQSVSKGLGVSRVGVLERVPGAGAGVTLDQLHARFAGSAQAVNTRGSVDREAEHHSHSLLGDGWLLQVYADGTRVRYRNYAVLESKQTLARPVAERLTQETLEQLGRRFISTELADMVRVAADETLVPLFTEHEINGSRSTAATASADVESVTASTIVFGRTVRGTAVVGPGSKVAIMFTNDGEVAGFDYDWPRYAPTGRSQDVMDITAIRQRARGITAAELDAPGVSIKRVECGYFDGGARRGDASAPIQAGCGFHYSLGQFAPGVGEGVAAYVDAIPAGRVVEADTGWAQAIQLRGGTPSDSEEAPGAP